MILKYSSAADKIQGVGFIVYNYSEDELALNVLY